MAYIDINVPAIEKMASKDFMAKWEKVYAIVTNDSGLDWADLFASKDETVTTICDFYKALATEVCGIDANNIEIDEGKYFLETVPTITIKGANIKLFFAISAIADDSYLSDNISMSNFVKYGEIEYYQPYRWKTDYDEEYDEWSASEWHGLNIILKV